MTTGDITSDIPLRFEDEFPEEAAFMMRVFAAGGRFKNPGYRMPGSVRPPRDVPRNAKCPCGSGVKTKHCHPEWTGSTPGPEVV